MSKDLANVPSQSREIATVSQSRLMATVTRFGEYVDEKGSKATSMGGLVISINRDIKRAYGMSRDEMPHAMLLNVSSVLMQVAETIDMGMTDRRTRAEIKLKIHATIKASGAAYLAINAQTAH